MKKHCLQYIQLFKLTYANKTPFEVSKTSCSHIKYNDKIYVVSFLLHHNYKKTGYGSKSREQTRIPFSEVSKPQIQNMGRDNYHHSKCVINW
jgi:hypothetical protein